MQHITLLFDISGRADETLKPNFWNQFLETQDFKFLLVIDNKQTNT